MINDCLKTQQRTKVMREGPMITGKHSYRFLSRKMIYDNDSEGRTKWKRQVVNTLVDMLHSQKCYKKGACF